VFLTETRVVADETTKSPVDTKYKGKQGSLAMVAIRNIILDHPSPNLRKTLPVIPKINKIPVIQNHECSISTVEAAVPTYHQRHGYQRQSTKAQRQIGNALTVAAETTKPTFIPNTESRDHLNRTPAIPAAMTVNKLSTKSHSTRSSKRTNLPLWISNSTGKAG